MLITFRHLELIVTIELENSNENKPSKQRTTEVMCQEQHIMKP